MKGPSAETFSLHLLKSFPSITSLLLDKRHFISRQPLNVATELKSFFLPNCVPGEIIIIERRLNDSAHLGEMPNIFCSHSTVRSFRINGATQRPCMYRHWLVSTSHLH